MEVSLLHVSDHHEVPSTSMPWSDTCVVQASTTRRPVPRIEDSEGSDAPRSVTDYTEQWGWCFIHIRSMLLHVICLLYVICLFYVVIWYMSVICLVLGPSSGSSGSVRIYRRVIFGKQN